MGGGGTTDPKVSSPGGGEGQIKGDLLPYDTGCNAI